MVTIPTLSRRNGVDLKALASERRMARRPLPSWLGPTVACVALSLAVAGCSDDDEGGSQDPLACTVTEQNAWIQSTMLEWYLENSQLPILEPADFDTPDEFLDALVEDVDLAPNAEITGADRFSVVLEFQEEQNRIANIFSGFGLLMQVEGTGDDRIFRLLDVFGTFEGEAASPASQAGLARGDAIETFDGEPVATVFNVDRLEGLKFIFGFDVGETHELGVLKRDGQQQTLTLEAAELTPTSVPLFKVFTLGDEEVGYVFFRDFDFASVEGLRQAIGFLAERGVTKVIIDQRYNLGGFVFVVDYLANLLLGNDLGSDPNNRGVIRSETWNGDKSSFNGSAFFSPPSCPSFLGDRDDLRQYDCQGPVVGLTGLTQLIFINSNNTASASEVILNSMRSHVDVAVVGARSVGKPVGSAPFPGQSTGEQQFCGLVLRPTTFRNVNADNEGDYFEGFVPDCPVADDPTQPIGDESEASIAAALNYVQGSTCTPSLGTGGLTAEGPRRRILLDAEHTWSYANSLARLRDQGRLFR